ncbi:Wzz/FepE/Etk N-terminal domain-containing protein [Marinobacter sp.]|uniref:Wzz/FepE/Etk N-terminal domain-containing protein n=1 Tax=Marinobacter sp. TaxID=50741 RepID=UPI003A8E6C10
MRPTEPFLVELAAVIVKCRKLFLSVFIAVLLLGIGFQLVAAPKYQYVTLIKLAQNGDGVFLTSGEGVVASIENQWLPQVTRAFQKDRGEWPEVKLRSRNASAGYVQILSIGAAHDVAEVEWLHTNLADKILAGQLSFERRARTRLEAQLASAKELVDAPGNVSSNSGSSDSRFFETLVLLEGKLAGMQTAEALVVAQRKDEIVGLGLVPRLALMFLLAFVSALIAVLVYRFTQRVERLVSNLEKQV